MSLRLFWALYQTCSETEGRKREEKKRKEIGLWDLNESNMERVLGMGGAGNGCTNLEFYFLT